MMKHVNYIIVGDGYAALFFAHQLIKEGKSFLLFSDGKKSASKVSAGIINPVVLKKITTFWKAQEQIDLLKITLSEIEEYTGSNYLIEEPIHRIFHDEKEKSLWMKKTDNEDLHYFLSKEVTTVEGVKNPFGTGEVLQSGRLNVAAFFDDFLGFLDQKGNLIKERFEYSELKPLENIYGNIHYGSIVFCEGMGVRENPFFSEIKVNPNKGHHLKVAISKKLKNQFTIKKKHFLFPLPNGSYYYGGTYDRDQTNHEIDDSATQQLVNGVSEFYPDPFEIIDVEFGFRPTVRDRRPILGCNPDYANLFVFNGLGARGILNGCYFARELYEHIEFQKPLHPEVAINRFE